MRNKAIPCHLVVDGKPLCEFEYLLDRVGACTFPSLAKARRASEAAHEIDISPSIVVGRCPNREKGVRGCPHETASR